MENNIECKKEYNSFEELYKDYKNVIDSEYSLRVEHLLEYLDGKIESKERECAENVSGANDGYSNQYWSSKARCYNDLRKELVKLLYADSEHSDYDHITRLIKEFKNRIIDNIYTRMESIGTPYREREIKFKRAGIIADIFEEAMNAAYFQSERHKIENINEKWSAKRCDEIGRCLENLISHSYQKGGQALQLFMLAKIGGNDKLADDILESSRSTIDTM